MLILKKKTKLRIVASKSKIHQHFYFSINSPKIPNVIFEFKSFCLGKYRAVWFGGLSTTRIIRYNYAIMQSRIHSFVFPQKPNSIHLTSNKSSKIEASTASCLFQYFLSKSVWHLVGLHLV